MRGTRWVLIWLLVIAWFAGSASADTGGSMGGGDWSGGGGGGGGDYSSSNSSSSSDYSYSSSDDYSSSRSSSRGGSFSPGVSMVVLILIVGAWIFGIWIKTQNGDVMSGPRFISSSYDEATVDVSVLRIAIDGRARKFVQSELTRIAKIADTKTAVGRLTMLTEVGLMLRRVRDAWVYGGAVNEPLRGQQGAQVVFGQHVTDARAKFMHETVRNADGTIVTQQAPESIPRSHEGAGLILVSIIVAARSELFTVAHIADGEDLRKALEAASHRSANDLVAIEIVWQPSDDDDRLSSIELEAKYPPPELIPIRDALVGKTFCSYCSGPYPAELVTCPHCGAPSEGHATANAA